MAEKASQERGKPTKPMSQKLYQIYDVDLEALESNLPALMDAGLAACNNAVVRKRWEQVKSIVSNVRWNYGPPAVVKTESATEDGEEWENG